MSNGIGFFSTTSTSKKHYCDDVVVVFISSTDIKIDKNLDVTGVAKFTAKKNTSS